MQSLTFKLLQNIYVGEFEFKALEKGRHLINWRILMGENESRGTTCRLAVDVEELRYKGG